MRAARQAAKKSSSSGRFYHGCRGEIHPQGEGLVDLEMPLKSSGAGGEIDNSMYVSDGSTWSRCCDDF